MAGGAGPETPSPAVSILSFPVEIVPLRLLVTGDDKGEEGGCDIRLALVGDRDGPAAT